MNKRHLEMVRKIYKQSVKRDVIKDEYDLVGRDLSRIERSIVKQLIDHYDNTVKDS